MSTRNQNAGIKYTDLPQATLPLDGTEVLALVQAGLSKQILISNLVIGQLSGDTITNIDFGNTILNPTYNFLGTGVTSIGGSITVGSPTGGDQGPGTINATNIFINGVPIGGGGGGGGPETVLTVANETATFPNSRQVLAGTNITFNDTVPNERTISSDPPQTLVVTALFGGSSSANFNGTPVVTWFGETVLQTSVDAHWDDGASNLVFDTAGVYRVVVRGHADAEAGWPSGDGTWFGTVFDGTVVAHYARFNDVTAGIFADTNMFWSDEMFVDATGGMTMVIGLFANAYTSPGATATMRMQIMVQRISPNPVIF